MPISITRLDHLVLTVRDIGATCDFYSRVLGMAVVTFGEGRTALSFGSQKINLHWAGHEIAPHAACPMPGSADLCLITDAEPAETLATLQAQGVPVVLGPVRRSGALGAIESIYLRDPDGNLIEIARYLEPDEGQP
ncbi:MAG TPA: VOC family protein [Ktedonobacterales bacterium]